MGDADLKLKNFVLYYGAAVFRVSGRRARAREYTVRQRSGSLLGLHENDNINDYV